MIRSQMIIGIELDSGGVRQSRAARDRLIGLHYLAPAATRLTMR